MIHLVKYDIKNDAQKIKTEYYNEHGSHIEQQELENILNKNVETQYFTIWEKDKFDFLMAINDLTESGEFCKIVYDEEEKKNVIQSFLSKDRGEMYDEEKTSVSVITGKLYPIDIKKDIGLINNYYKYLTIERKKEQDKLNKDAQDKGNDIHLVLERWLCDKKHFSLKNVEDYIDDEIKYKDLVIEALTKYPKYKERGVKNYSSINYIVDQLYYTDLVYSEIFVGDDRVGIQGCVDALLYTKKGLVLKDFKTTSTMSQGKPVTKSISQLGKYYRQMILYGYMLCIQGFITKKEFRNLIYNNDMFYFLRNEYREYYYDTSNISKDLKDILLTIDWFKSYL